MKNVSFLIFLLVISVLSCKKKSDAIVKYTGQSFFPPIPNMAGINNTLPYPVISGVWGVLASVTIRGNYSDASGNTLVYSNDAVADFAGPNAEAGTVSVNNQFLDTATLGLFNPYEVYFNQKINPSDTFNFVNGADWVITGGRNVPGLSFNNTGSFPAFTGILPIIVSASGISLTFDATNNSGADSAFIMLNALDSRGACFSINSKVVSANGGTATITADDINSFPFAYFPTVYYEVFLYKYTINPFGNKQFAFVDMDEVIQNITFN